MRWIVFVMCALVMAGCSKKEKAAPTPPTPETTPAKAGASKAVKAPEKAEGKTDAKADAKAPAAAHLTEAQAKPLFPASLAGFTLEKVKIKPKTAQWHEIKGTYKGADGEVKLVINDWPPAGNPEWATKLEAASQKTKGYVSMMEAKDDKHTLMVRVAPRFRVDFKSRQVKPEALKKMGEAFDFKAVEAAAK